MKERKKDDVTGTVTKTHILLNAQNHQKIHCFIALSKPYKNVLVFIQHSVLVVLHCSCNLCDFKVLVSTIIIVLIWLIPMSKHNFKQKQPQTVHLINNKQDLWFIIILTINSEPYFDSAENMLYSHALVSDKPRNCSEPCDSRYPLTVRKTENLL